MYLLEEDVRKTLRALAALASEGSEIAFDAASKSLEGFPLIPRTLGIAERRIVEMLGEPLHFLTDPQSLRTILTEEKFRVREICGTNDLFARYLTKSFLKDPKHPIEYLVLAARTN